MTGTSVVGLGHARTSHQHFSGARCARMIGIVPMKIMELFMLIQHIDNGWAFAAFLAALVYLWMTR